MSIVQRLLRRRPSFARAFQRHACEIDGTLVSLNRMAKIPGRLVDLGAGGALFRPRLRYLMDRKGEPASLTINGVEMIGTITGTSPRGYGLRFDEPIGDHAITCVLEKNQAEAAA